MCISNEANDAKPVSVRYWEDKNRKDFRSAGYSLLVSKKSIHVLALFGFIHKTSLCLNSLWLFWMSFQTNYAQLRSEHWILHYCFLFQTNTLSILHPNCCWPLPSQAVLTYLSFSKSTNNCDKILLLLVTALWIQDMHFIITSDWQPGRNLSTLLK